MRLWLNYLKLIRFFLSSADGLGMTLVDNRSYKNKKNYASQKSLPTEL